MSEVPEEQAPRKARELYEKGYAALERGNLDYAMDLLQEALELEPRFLKARRALRAAQLKKFKASGHGGLVAHALATVAGAPTFLRAWASLRARPLEALKASELLMRRDPLHKGFVRLLGRAAVAAEMPEAAIQTLEMAVEHYPRDAQLVEWLGELYLAVNQPRKARECFEKIVEWRPNDPKAIKALKDATALDTLQKGGWATAESYRDVIKDEREAVLLEQQAKAVKTERDLRALLEDTRRKIQQQPENINYRRALADLYVRLGQFEEARQALEEAQRITGGADPELDLAIRNVRLRQFDTEIERLRAAGDHAGAEAKAREREAFVLEDAWERVRRYPNDLQFRYDLGVILYERGQLTEAIQQFQVAQRHPHRRLRALFYLGLCFKQKGQYDLALQQLEKAASEISSMDETKKDILYEMGLVAEALGDRQKAKACFKEIYAVDIGYKDVADKVERVYAA